MESITTQNTDNQGVYKHEKLKVFKSSYSTAIGTGQTLKHLDPFFDENVISTSFYSVSSPDTIENVLKNHLEQQGI
jgi:hypothetical protein